MIKYIRKMWDVMGHREQSMTISIILTLLISVLWFITNAMIPVGHGANFINLVLSVVAIIGVWSLTSSVMDIIGRVNR